jgi:hypothetical protein
MLMGGSCVGTALRGSCAKSILSQYSLVAAAGIAGRRKDIILLTFSFLTFDEKN